MAEPHDLQGLAVTSPLLAGEVQVWRVSLNLSEADQQHCWSLLSADEQQRAQTFRLDLHRQRFVAARGMLRQLLSPYLAIAPQHIQFSYGDHGKPFLNPALHPGQPPLHFNLAHSGSRALYAITLHHPVGIDLEQVRPLPNLMQLARRFFSPNEYGAIASLPSDLQQHAFFQCWTCKEAVLKATGEGLAGLQHVEVAVHPNAPVHLLRLRNPEELEHWTLLSLPPIADPSPTPNSTVTPDTQPRTDDSKDLRKNYLGAIATPSAPITLKLLDLP